MTAEGLPCPVCGRVKDADCCISTDMVLCHGKIQHKPGDLVGDWAFTKVSSDGRCGVFVPHKPLSKPQTREAQTFDYGPNHRVKRYYRHGKKLFCPQHKEGNKWVNGAGPVPSPLYRQDKVNGSPTVVELEGEKFADIAAAAAGLAAVSQPGHAWSNDNQRLERYRQLAAAGTKRLVIVADNDAKGVKRANASAASATEAGLEVRLLLAAQVWPGIPSGGSIDDAPGTPEKRAEVLKEAAKQQKVWTEPVSVVEQHGDEGRESAPLTYTELIQQILQAVTHNDLDSEMALKAELMNRFRVPVGQVEADLLRHHMQLETAGEKKKAPPESLDLDQVEGMDFLIDGHVPENDQTMLFGKAGTGKTTAAVGYARSILFGEGFLDHPYPARRGRVLFIASKS